MAARGLVNGRGPRQRRGRDSAKRVVLEIIPLKFFFLFAAFFHWAAAAGVSLFAVVDGAYDCYNYEAGYGDDCDYC